MQQRCPPPSVPIRRAAGWDAAAIADLVNAAYRPPAPGPGWTHEAALLAGPRTDAQQVRALIGGTGTVLLATEGDALLGCVHVAPEGDSCHVGMLAVHPARQGRGLGSQLLAAAEDLAVRRHGARQLQLQVVSSRPELQGFYERRGYRMSGAAADFPADAGVGRPLVGGLLVLDMAKPCAPEGGGP